ncbi:disulfide bond formation protein B (plasmid) [Streptoverticillium reticulum]|uniref:disulfide bond formation protein B n=1 Tax=Streptoverticillium reticulum TaxID=1433415 RepID=UPI0039BF27E2
MERFISRFLPPAYIVGLCGVLIGAFSVQLFMAECPCPLCMLQRYFFLLAIVGPLWALCRQRKKGPSRRVTLIGWSVSIPSCIAGLVVSGRQVLLHIAPGDPGYGTPLIGLHLYTWAFLTFFLAMIAAVVGIAFAAGYVDSTALPRCVTGVVFFIVAANVVGIFFLEGFHWVLPDNPTHYALWNER